MPERELFTRHVRQALTHFHSSARLEASALSQQLALPGVGAGGVTRSLRKLLRQAIESLKPAASVPFGRPEWLEYRLLWTCYVNGRGRLETCQELAISESTFYRHHGQALEAVASVLWDSRKRQSETGETAALLGLNVGPADDAAQVAIDLARKSGRQRVDLGRLLEGVRQTILPLAKERGILLEIDAPPSLPATYGDPALLRQIVLNVLTEGIAVSAGNTLYLSIAVGAGEATWRLKIVTGPDFSPSHIERAPGVAVSKALVEAYEGRLWITKEDDDSIALSFTTTVDEPKTILVIDDDVDMIRLYKLYLRHHKYAVQVARTREELAARLRETVPDLIILDILMPRWDGWSILGDLQTNEETRRVPVVICSVLSQPQLALALGARAVLRKPIDQQGLLRTVQSALAPGDSGG